MNEALFNREAVRQALRAWHSTQILGELPLAMLPIVEAHRLEKGYRATTLGRGLALRELLEAALKALRPDEGAPQPAARSWRPFFSLHEQYLQGRSVAWVRAQMHISRRTYHNVQADALDRMADSLAAWNAQRGEAEISLVVPAGRPALFMPPPQPGQPLLGRAGLLAQIKERLQAGADVGLVGLPGSGKTSLAVELAHDPELLAHFSDGVLWAGLGASPDVLAVLGRWAEALRLLDEERPLWHRPAELAALVRRELAHRRCLLIIDDVWDAAAAETFRLGGARCAHLVTSRQKGVAASLAGDQLWSVEALNAVDGLALLARRAPQIIEAEPVEAQKLVQAVGGLPLALVLMGARLQSQPLAAANNLSEMLVWLQSAGSRATAGDEFPALWAAVGASVAHLTPKARQALADLSLFPPKPNSFSAVAAQAVTGVSTRILDTLLDQGLLEVAGPERYTLHQVIAAYGRQFPTRPEAVRRLAAYFVDLAEHSTADHSQLAADLNNVLLALELSYEGRMSHQLERGVLALLPFLTRRGMHQTARQQLERAILLFEGKEITAQKTTIYHHLGYIQQWLGNYDQAAATTEKALALARPAGLVEIEIAALVSLGTIRRVRGAPAEAEQLFRQALHLARQSDNLKGEGSALAGLAESQQRQGQYREAAATFRQALVASQRAGHLLGEVIALNGLGNASVASGDYAGAVAVLEEALALSRTTGNRALVGQMLHNLGNAHLNQGDQAAARHAYGACLAACRAAGDRTTEASTLNNLGLIHMGQGELALSTTYFQEALALNRETGIRQHQGIALHNLGRIALLQGDYPAALAQLEAALAIADEVGDRAGRSRTLRNIAQVQIYRGQDRLAETAALEAVQIAAELADPLGHSQSLAVLGLLHHFRGDEAAAESYGRQALAQAQAIAHREAQATALDVLGRTCLGQGRLDEAADHFGEARRWRQALGAAHLAAEASAGLAEVARRQGNLAVAQSRIEEVLAFLDERSPAGMVAPACVYTICLRVLEALGDERANRIREAAQQLPFYSPKAGH